MSNEKTVINAALGRWLEVPGDLSASVDCEGCTLASLRPEARRRWRSFKCCTFQPFWAGFYYGAMLEAGESPPSVDAEKAVLQPIGVVASASFRRLHAATAQDRMGAANTCTFYDFAARRCRIWNFRPAECSFYFCAEDAKKPEREAWSERAFQIESGLAQMALAQIGFTADAIAEQVGFMNEPPDDLSSLARAEAEEIYRASWAWAKTQNAHDVAALLC